MNNCNCKQCKPTCEWRYSYIKDRWSTECGKTLEPTEHTDPRDFIRNAKVMKVVYCPFCGGLLNWSDNVLREEEEDETG